MTPAFAKTTTPRRLAATHNFEPTTIKRITPVRVRESRPRVDETPQPIPLLQRPLIQKSFKKAESKCDDQSDSSMNISKKHLAATKIKSKSNVPSRQGSPFIMTENARQTNIIQRKSVDEIVYKPVLKKDNWVTLNIKDEKKKSAKAKKANQVTPNNKSFIKLNKINISQMKCSATRKNSTQNVPPLKVNNSHNHSNSDIVS